MNWGSMTGRLAAKKLKPSTTWGIPLPNCWKPEIDPPAELFLHWLFSTEVLRDPFAWGWQGKRWVRAFRPWWEWLRWSLAWNGSSSAGRFCLQAQTANYIRIAMGDIAFISADENYFLLACFAFFSLRFSFNVFVGTFFTLFWEFLPLAMSYSLFRFNF